MPKNLMSEMKHLSYIVSTFPNIVKTSQTKGWGFCYPAQYELWSPLEVAFSFNSCQGNVDVWQINGAWGSLGIYFSSIYPYWGSIKNESYQPIRWGVQQNHLGRKLGQWETLKVKWLSSYFNKGAFIITQRDKVHLGQKKLRLDIKLCIHG